MTEIEINGRTYYVQDNGKKPKKMSRGKKRRPPIEEEDDFLLDKPQAEAPVENKPIPDFDDEPGDDFFDDEDDIKLPRGRKKSSKPKKSKQPKSKGQKPAKKSGGGGAMKLVVPAILCIAVIIIIVVLILPKIKAKRDAANNVLNTPNTDVISDEEWDWGDENDESGNAELPTESGDEDVEIENSEDEEWVW